LKRAFDFTSFSVSSLKNALANENSQQLVVPALLLVMTLSLVMQHSSTFDPTVSAIFHHILQIKAMTSEFQARFVFPGIPSGATTASKSFFFTAVKSTSATFLQGDMI
jgi:hypothetical protein